MLIYPAFNAMTIYIYSKIIKSNETIVLLTNMFVHIFMILFSFYLIGMFTI